MLPGEERLLELGDDPHDALSRDGVDQRLDASLELPDVDRAGVELCGRRLEHDDLRIHALEGGAGKRGLADAVLADEEHRSRRVLLEGSDGDLDELASTTDEQGRWIVERPIPDPAGAAQRPQRTPVLEARPDVRPEVGLEAIEERLELVGPVE